MKSGPTGQMRSSNPPPGCGKGCAGDPQTSVWGLTARKSAVWAEGLADGAPWARPGHHQAASCGLRRCQELGLREFVWVVASLPWRRGGRHRQAARRKSVHRSAKLASRRRFGAFVYTVATRALRCELRRVVRAPQPPWRAGGAPSLVASPLVRKTGSARVAPPLGWHLRQGSNPHKSSMSLGTQGYTKDEKAVHRAKAPSPWICSSDGLVTLFPFKVGRDWSDSGGIQVIGFAVEQIPGEGVAVRSVGVLSRHWSGRETPTRNRGGSREAVRLLLESTSR